MAGGLLPDPLCAADLIPALRGLAAKTNERFDVRCELDAENIDESRIRKDATANLIFQIAGEAVHNAIKHAEASKIEMKVEMDDAFRLSVHDDGKGFDTHRHKANINGLRIMRYRSESIGGNVEIESSTEHGTRVLLTIPAAAVR